MQSREEEELAQGLQNQGRAIGVYTWGCPGDDASRSGPFCLLCGGLVETEVRSGTVRLEPSKAILYLHLSSGTSGVVLPQR